MLLKMNKLLIFILCFSLINACKSNTTEIKEPAGRIWMKKIHTYLVVSNTEVPAEYDIFEHQILESPDRMGKLYDYLRTNTADVPALPRDYVDELTDGFPIPDVPLISVWMSIREQDAQLAGDYSVFKQQMAESTFRLRVYNHLKSADPSFTTNYGEFCSDMGFSNKKVVY